MVDLRLLQLVSKDMWISRAEAEKSEGLHSVPCSPAFSVSQSWGNSKGQAGLFVPFH